MNVMAKDLIPRNSGLFDLTPFNFFENVGRNFFEGFTPNLAKTDIHETENDYLVEVELPGIPKENIQVHYENGVLSIEGQHQTDEKTEDEKGQLIRSERSFSSIRRQFMLDNVKETDIKANYEGGILKVTLPKSEEKQERKAAIPIE